MFPPSPCPGQAQPGPSRWGPWRPLPARAARGEHRARPRGSRVRAPARTFPGSGPRRALPLRLLGGSSSGDCARRARGLAACPAVRCGAMAEPRPGLALRFQRLFLAARPLRSLPWPELEQSLRTAPDSALLADILHKTILHPLCVKYPPSAKYRRCFLTELIKKPTGDCVSLCESTALISGGTTGLVTWEAALHLAQWALENPSVFRDRTVLELGSGIGFTGIAICKTCQPRTFIFSDCHPRVLRQLGENIRLNGFIPEPAGTWSIQTESQGQEVEGENCQNPKVIVAELDWGSVTEKQLLGLRADVVIAADVVYDPEIILVLIGMLQKLSTSRADTKAPEVFIAFTIRNPATYQLFQAELDKVGIRWQMIAAHSSCNFLYDVQPDVTILQLFI
ncbi:protein-lysine N-methyltransferase EEF2KMT isoform X3 [Corvus moneduloides]|uniref:protein-lysine N-methyltransferase EEF2KMT isoform X3 n=1 Tax=Corvus moneduloides TaxID=1196302 RepID=UPI001362D81A|nr:protein-lysine N-methyltransferase EEF2KMT isoform X3 [Corvus moneduloides]